MKKTIVAVTVLLFFSPVFSQSKNTVVVLQRTALERNPRILSMSKDVEMAEKRINQSTSLDDPKLKLGVNNLPTSNFSFTMEDMTTKEIGITQMIPLGKLGSRKNVAMKEYEKAKERLRQEKADILHMLRMNAYELSYTRASVKILEDIKKQLKLVIDSEVASSKTGMGSIANVIKANIEYNMIDEELIVLRQKEKENIQKIRYLAGGPVDFDFETLPPPGIKEISMEETVKTIISRNPELAVYRLELEISRGQTARVRDEYIPDMELGFSYMQRQNGDGKKRDDMVSGMVTFNIPVWSASKNSSMVGEMEKKYESAESLLSDKQNDLLAQAQVLAGKMTKWSDLYRLYGEKLIPQTELAVEANMSRYKSNSGDFLSVIDTVRMLLRYRKELAMSLTEYYSAASELGRLTGVEVLE